MERGNEAGAAPLEDTPAQLTLHVLDSGPGLPEAELERAFEPFFRLEASRNRATGAVPTDLMVDYYSQRASAGLIIAEASQISAMAAPI